MTRLLCRLFEKNLPRLFCARRWLLVMGVALVSVSCTARGPAKEDVLAARAASRAECPPAVARKLERWGAQLVLVGTTRGDAKKGTTSANGGTAFPISRDGYHLTAAHCLRGRERSIQVVFRQARDGSMACDFARVVWNSPKHDLALLHIRGFPTTRPFTLGDAAECAPGDAVYALGLAEKDLRPGAWASFSRGRVATVMPPAAGDGVAVTTIVHETPVWHGDSGGPLLNDAGRVMGVHSKGTFGGVNTDLLPSRAALERIIAQDRRANRNRPPLVRAARGGSPGIIP